MDKPKGVEWTASRLWLTALFAILIAGCASQPLQYKNLDPPTAEEVNRIDLEATPFFPQTAYQCGPAALATVLRVSGVDSANPKQLADQVYLPGQRGTLQTELLAATRRANRVPYILEPKLDHLLSEIRDGNPVLVLQNLRLPRWPQWHYAVVVGFDLETSEIVLRSGQTRRKVLSIRRFERTWQRGDYWALVVPQPGQTPATASATGYLEAVAALEDQQRWRPATQAYIAAHKRWPDNPLSSIGLGNIAYQTQKYDQAVRYYQAAAAIAPEMPAAHYNLAWALLQQGKHGEARRAASKAQSLEPSHSRYGRAVADIDAAAEAPKDQD